MKGKQNWVHYSFGGDVPMLKRNENGGTTACGKTARRIRVTRDKNNVTCRRCLDALAEESKVVDICEHSGILGTPCDKDNCNSGCLS